MKIAKKEKGFRERVGKRILDRVRRWIGRMKTGTKDRAGLIICESRETVREERSKFLIRWGENAEW